MTASISKQIRDAFAGSIVVISVFAILLLFVNQVNSFKNQKIVETITTEYSIISLSNDLVTEYNNITKNPDSESGVADYYSTQKKLDTVFSNLDSQVTNQESRILLNGLKNTVNQVTSVCNAGILDIQNNNFLNISEYFLKATTNNDFVRENTAVLLQKELEYLSQTQEKSKTIYTYSIVISSVIFVLIFIFLIIYANVFSQQIISPVRQLTETAKIVASGEMNISINQKLLDRTDEIGVLSKSLAIMLDTIKSKIVELKKLNDFTAKSREEIKLTNDKLTKLNSFMVNRELKMIELKKRIAEVEKN